MTLLYEDFGSNPFGQCASVACDECGSVHGLRRDGERFVCSDEVKCRRYAQSIGRRQRRRRAS